MQISVSLAPPSYHPISPSFHGKFRPRTDDLSRRSDPAKCPENTQSYVAPLWTESPVIPRGGGGGEGEGNGVEADGGGSPLRGEGSQRKGGSAFRPIFSRCPIVGFISVFRSFYDGIANFAIYNSRPLLVSIAFPSILSLSGI